MRPSQRIVLNTIATYIRSVIGAGLALFSSRWIFNGLGQTDYGLFSVVGSIIIFMTFLNTVMASSAARHYAYSIGQGDLDEVNNWFNTSLSIHSILAFVLVLAGWPIGEYLISHVLSIPLERVSTCLWVFRCSLISAFVSMISIPFIAMFTAKQRIAELAIWNMAHSIMIFSLAWLVLHADGDRLLYYGIRMVGILVLVRLSQVVFAVFVFHECHINCLKWFNKHKTKEILSFAGWNFIGVFGTILRDQGSALLLNINFGPKVNAAYGIANQVSAQANQLAAAMLGAFSPEITTSEGRGDRAQMIYLSQTASKFGTFLVLLFAIPLMVEMEYLLKIWLVSPPEYAVLFCRLILATFIIERLSCGYVSAVQAHGKIAAYQATMGTCLILTLPIAWVFIKMGASPPRVAFAFILTMIAVSMGRIYWVRRLLGVPISRWLLEVVRPCMIVAFLSMIPAFIFYFLLSTSLLRLICITFTSVTVSSLSIWFFALNRRERDFIRRNLIAVRNKIKGSRVNRG